MQKFCGATLCHGLRLKLEHDTSFGAFTSPFEKCAACSGSCKRRRKVHALYEVHMHQLKLTTLLSSVMKREHHLPPRLKTWEEPALQCQGVDPCMAWDCGTTEVLFESGSHRCIMCIMCIT